MHTSLTNYIKYVRIERAKLLLTTTGLSLQEIADRLHFCSRSYFGKVFHEVVAARRWNIARSNKSFCLHYSAHCPVLNNNKIVTNVKFVLFSQQDEFFDFQGKSITVLPGQSSV